MQNISIGNYAIGEYQPCFIIAEAGVNHNGSLDMAFQLVEKAKEIGADCIKFQTFKANKVITRTAPKAEYQLKVTDRQESQYEMLKKLELSEADFSRIAEHCRSQGIQFLSTPYNREDAVLLQNLGVDAFKIASGQIVELSFLEFMASLQKPLILSSGMATLSEIDDALRTIRQAGNDKVVLLQCTTNYPSRNEEANIRAMVSLQQAFGVWTGYSDHVPNNYAAYAAVALGARVIEKHFTLDRNLPGPDHSASLDATQFEEFIRGIRLTEQALGSPVKIPTEAEVKNATGMRRSITANCRIPAGTVITEDMLEYKRPATGLPPKMLPLILGREAAVDIEEDILLSFGMIRW
jgi:N-acetylneuraminate synthase/N,N'-diacetyllegionaminate synthase